MAAAIRASKACRRKSRIPPTTTEIPHSKINTGSMDLGRDCRAWSIGGRVQIVFRGVMRQRGLGPNKNDRTEKSARSLKMLFIVARCIQCGRPEYRDYLTMLSP